MAEKFYWLKLKRDFFKRHDIRIIESMPNGKDYILFYLKLLCESVDTYGIINQAMLYQSDFDPLPFIALFTKFELLKKVGENEYQLKDCDKNTVCIHTDYKSRNRNSPQYREWRTAVFERDTYTCQKCRSKGGRLEAHHIIAWVDDKNLRFDVNNGITLCKCCHNQIHKRRKVGCFG